MRSLLGHALRLVLPAAAFAVVCCWQTVAHADPLVLTFSNPDLTGLPGTTVTLFASATNTGATSPGTVTILGISGSNTFFPRTPVDTSPGDANFQFQQVASGSTLGPLPFFLITIPDHTPFGSSISGSISFFYRNDQGVFLLTDPARFTVTVGAAVPEPATLLLLSTGLAGVSRRGAEEESEIADR